MPAWAGELELLKDASAFGVRLTHDVAIFHAEHVERDENERDGRAAAKHALADERKVGATLVVERDEFAVEIRPHRKIDKELDVLRHVPARRLRTRSGPSVETIARKPSHFTSKA
jgi:hypothetical protein